MFSEVEEAQAPSLSCTEETPSLTLEDELAQAAPSTWPEAELDDVWTYVRGSVLLSIPEKWRPLFQSPVG